MMGKLEKVRVAAERTPSQLLPLPPRRGWLLPPTVTGLPLSFVHTKSVFAHMRVALSAVVRLSTVSSTKPTIPLNVCRLTSSGKRCA